MTEGDIFEAVIPNTNASQREALRALATGGTQARDAYLAGIAAQQQDRTALLQDILNRSTAINAPAEATAQLQAAASPRLDARTLALTGAQGSNATLLDTLGKANTDYFGQVNAALPIVKQRADTIIAAQKARAEQEALDRQLQLQIHQLALQAAEARAREASTRASSGGAGKPLTDAQLKTRLLGAGRAAQQQAAGDVNRYVSQGQFFSNPEGYSNLRNQNEAMANSSIEALARQIGVQAGLDPSLVYGLIVDPVTKQPVSQQRAAHIGDVTSRVQRYASPSTAQLFIDIVGGTPETETTPALPAARTLPMALGALSQQSDAFLRSHGISRDALRRWLTEYFAV